MSCAVFLSHLSFAGSAFRCVFFQDNESFGWGIGDSLIIPFWPLRKSSLKFFFHWTRLKLPPFQTVYLLRFPNVVYFLHTLYLLRLLTTHSMPSRTPSPLVALQAWICHSRSWRWRWSWWFVIEIWIKMMVGDCIPHPLRIWKYTLCFLLKSQGGHLDCVKCHALGHLRWRGRAQEVLQREIQKLGWGPARPGSAGPRLTI